MKVLLKEDVKNLGSMGDLVTVSDGYARNYLIPKQLAVVADDRNIKEFEHHKKAIFERAAKLRKTSQDLSDRLSTVSLSISAKAGDEEKLFGSVTTMDIADALKGEGFDVDRKKIVLDEPIKRLGTYPVTIKLHPDVTTQIMVHVVQE